MAVAEEDPLIPKEVSPEHNTTLVMEAEVEAIKNTTETNSPCPHLALRRDDNLTSDEVSPTKVAIMKLISPSYSSCTP